MSDRRSEQTYPAAIADAAGTVIGVISHRLEPPAGLADDPVAVVAFDGDIDRDTAPALQDALVLAISDYPRTCLDMGGVDFFGAAGVNLLVAAHRHAVRLGHSLSLCQVHSIAGQVLTIAGLHEVIPTVRIGR